MTSSQSLGARYARFQQQVPAQTKTIGGVTWRWYEQGHGTPAIVILPGAVGGADLFFLLFDTLAPQMRVIGIDLPYVEDATAAVDQMNALLDELGVRDAIFLGASFSGLLVQAFARRHPERTRALILSHTGALDPARADRQRVNARRAAKIPLSISRGMLRLVVRLLLRGIDERRFWIERYDEVLNALDRSALVSRYLLEASIEDRRDAPWRGDVLVIHSDNDAVAKPEEQARLRDAYPTAAFHLFKGAGHSSYTKDPDAYAAAILRFVTARPRA